MAPQRTQWIALLSLLVTVLCFVQATTWAPLSKFPDTFDRKFRNTEFSEMTHGWDFWVPFRCTQTWRRKGTNVYSLDQPLPDCPIYDYIPQSMVLVLPFTFLPQKIGYFSVLFLGLGLMFALFCLLCRKLSDTSLLLQTAVFFTLVFLSHAGVFLFERGNLDLLAAPCVYAAFLCLLGRKLLACAWLLGLASCLKPMYAPFFVFLLTLPRCLPLVATFFGVHLGAALVLRWMNGSWDLFTLYWKHLPLFLQHKRFWIENNVSVLSLLSFLFPRANRYLMGLGSSLFVLITLSTLGLLFFRLHRAKTRSEALPMAAASFIYFCFCTTLWQFTTLTYSTLILLPALPVLENLAARETRQWVRFLFATEAIFFGLMFSPFEFKIPLFGYLKSPFFFLGFLNFLVILAGHFVKGDGESPANKAPVWNCFFYDLMHDLKLPTFSSLRDI